MGAVYFYHLTQTPLEATLPALLTKARGAGWRVYVRGASDERMEWLDKKLWQGPDNGFLAHGLAGGEFDSEQPVLLGTGTKAANDASCLMCVDGAGVAAGEAADMQRCCILFDGNDGAALQTAREQWKSLTDADCAAQYWSQESGKWAMRAENTP